MVILGEYAHPDASAPSIEIDEIEHASAGFGHKPTSAASCLRRPTSRFHLAKSRELRAFSLISAKRTQSLCLSAG